MEHCYLVCYDIVDPRRWRKVYKTMRGYGEWLQLSVFQCRLSRRKLLTLQASLNSIVAHDEDNVLIIDLGPAESVRLKVECIGKPYQPIEKKPVIV